MRDFYSSNCIYSIFYFFGISWYGGCNVLGKSRVLERRDVLATNQRFQIIEFFDYRKLK